MIGKKVNHLPRIEGSHLKKDTFISLFFDNPSSDFGSASLCTIIYMNVVSSSVLLVDLVSEPEVSNIL